MRARTPGSSRSVPRGTLYGPEQYEIMPTSDWERGVYWPDGTTGPVQRYQNEPYSVPGSCSSGMRPKTIKAPYLDGPNSGGGRAVFPVGPPDRPVSTVWQQPGMLGKTITPESGFEVRDLPQHNKDYIFEASPMR